jgi:hypothetical protein
MALSSMKRKAAIAVCVSLLGALLAIAVHVSSAASLGVPTITVEVPTVPVKTPTVSLKTPTVPVKTPTVPIKIPTVPVKTPTVTVKAPTAPVKTPTVSAKTPTVPVKTVPAKAPSVSVKVPSVPTSAAPSVHVPTARSRAGQMGGAVTGSGPTSAGSPGSNTSANVGSATGGSGRTSFDGGPSTYGQAPTAGYASGAPGVGRRISRSERARIAGERFLKETVGRLQGCLRYLPERPRVALQLRTGLGVPRALGPDAVAARLHVGIARFTRLERRAIRELRSSARTHSCAQVSELLAGVMAFIGVGFGSGEAGPTSGVKAVSFSFKPSRAHSTIPNHSSHGGLFGAAIPEAASDVILVLLLLFGAGVAVSVVVADNAGQGPRHWQWRRRVINRLPWWR